MCGGPRSGRQAVDSAAPDVTAADSTTTDSTAAATADASPDRRSRYASIEGLTRGRRVRQKWRARGFAEAPLGTATPCSGTGDRGRPSTGPPLLRCRPSMNGHSRKQRTARAQRRELRGFWSISVQAASAGHVVYATMRDIAKRDELDAAAQAAGVELPVRRLDVRDSESVDAVTLEGFETPR